MIGIKCEKLRRYLERERQILPEFFCCMDGVKNLKFCIDVQLSTGVSPASSTQSAKRCVTNLFQQRVTIPC